MLSASGRYERQGGEQLSLSLATDSLQELFSLLVAEPRQQSWPALSSARLQGSVALDLLVRGCRGRLEAASGRLQVGDLTASLPGTASLEGFSADVPFALERRPGAAAPPKLEGSLSLAALKAGGLSGRDLSLKLHLEGDSLMVAQPLELSFYGGSLRLSGVRAEALASPERRVWLEGVSVSAGLGELSQDLLGQPLRGKLEGSLPQVVYSRGRWQASGGLVASLFGGSVEVRDPWVEDPLRTSRSFGANITFQDILLEPLTGRLAGFGKVTGTVRGYVRDLEIAYGQPARFDLLIETESSEAPQRVSVEAVESISTIGTGTTAGLKGIFFDLLSEFRYSKIGICASLRNDVFRLRGTVREGGVEYLVRRSWLGGIDVVNRNPDNAIGFKDMRERIERIFKRKAQVK